MSPKSPAGAAAHGRRAGTIRPAVPLIYEPRARGGGPATNGAEAEEAASGKTKSDQLPEWDEDAVAKNDVQKQWSASPTSQLVKKDLLQSQIGLGDPAVGFRKATKHEAREMERDRSKMLRHTEGSTHRLVMGREMEKGVQSVESEDSRSCGESTHHSLATEKCSSLGVVDNPMSFGEDPFKATDSSDPAVNPAPTIQFGDYVSDIPFQRPYSKQHVEPSQRPQTQDPFAKSWNEVPRFQPIGGQLPPTPSSASLDDGIAPFDPKLAGHIASHFNVERYADVRLIVTHNQGRFGETTFYVHKVLVSRSETIRRLLDEAAGCYDKADGRLVVKIDFNDRFITPTALAAAIQSCYGHPLSNFLPITARREDGFKSNRPAADMPQILALVAAGQFLKLEDVALRGIERAQEALHWDTLECALNFGMESCIHRHESPEALLLSNFVCPGPFDDLVSIDCAAFMLGSSLSFVASSFPDQWTLDWSVMALPNVDRLPVASEVYEPRLRSSLARIRFGLFPPEIDPEASDRDTLISKVVLSVPFAHLCHIAECKSPSLIRQLPQIIEERERRRLVALNSQVPWDQRFNAKESSWHAVGIEESYIPGDSQNGNLGLACMPVSIYNTSADQEEARKREEASLTSKYNPQSP